MDCVCNIKNNEKLRESLIELKSIVKNEPELLDDRELEDKLLLCLSHEDPKVRKNSAILLGYYPHTTQALLDAYHQETTDYVKEAYLKGISQQDCRYYYDELQDIQNQLLKVGDSTLKHIQAQLKILNPLILNTKSHKKKYVKLQHAPVDVVLTSLPYYQFVLFEPVLHLKYKPVSQGVLVRTQSLYELLPIRTYKEMLLPLRGASSLPIDITAIEEGLKRCNLIELLEKLYDDHSVFYYRVVDQMHEKNSQLTKKISDKLFELYPYVLLNSQEHYDIEIIVKELKKGKVNFYLKLSHLENPRFEYRRSTISTSMQPYVAATLVELAKPYMEEDAMVLDPFCGTGTLLIERNVVKAAKFAVGIDVYGKGIEIARKNTKAAGQLIHYIHKDALRFSHSEFFDEIITDMPTISQMNDSQQLHDLYDRFFARIHRIVKPGGYAFIYTSEISLVRKNLRLQDDYLVLKEHYEIPRGKNMFYFFIVKVK